MNEKIKAVLIASGVALAGLTGAIVDHSMTQPQVIVKEVPGEIQYIPQIEVVNNTVIKTVDKEVVNPLNTEMLQFLQDNVDEDVTIGYITFENEAKAIAETILEEDFISMLKDEDFFEDGNVFEDYRKSEVSVKKVYDADVVSRDFEDKDVTLVYEVKVKAKESGENAEYQRFEVEFPFVDGELDMDDVVISLI